ncbi:MAG: dihydroorotate dehydrogenase electron transfer subunit [Planctomyces sp.]
MPGSSESCSDGGQCSELPGMVADAVQHDSVVVDVRRVALETWMVRLRCPEIARRIVPGQFLMIRPTGTSSDPLLGRPFALYRVFNDSDGKPADVEFGFVRVGKMTSLMAEWRPGDRVRVWGPLGNGFPLPECQHLICVAGGIGQTPFLTVLQEAKRLRTFGVPERNPKTIPETLTMCYGVRSREAIAGVEDFEQSGIGMQIATEDGSFGHHGRVTDVLRRCLSESRGSVWVYSCGPEPMMKAVAEICAEVDVPCWLSLETPMACGFGACFSCVTRVREPDGSWDYRRTCVEGPVFRADRLLL